MISLVFWEVRVFPGLMVGREACDRAPGAGVLAALGKPTFQGCRIH